jgi:TonB family protein
LYNLPDRTYTVKQQAISDREDTQLGSIFISYRRHDSEGEAGRLFDDLVAQFGENSVFMDVAGIEAGRDFRKAIDESVATCGVLLALIGPGWLDEKNEKGERRLDDPNDFVRVETASALRRDIPVIPVLLRGAKMPRSDQLPPDLQELAYRNCVEITHARWRSDVQLLVEPLRRLIGDPRKAASSSSRATAAKLDEPQSELPAPLIDSSKPQTTSPIIDAATLQHVSRELAHHIGPIADFVVKRAAPLCTSADELYLKVAEEIESKGEREEFLSRVALVSTLLSKIPESTKLPQTDLKAPAPVPPPPAIVAEFEIRPSKPQTKASQSKYLLMIGAGILVILSIVVGKRFLSAGAGSTAGNSAGKRTSQTVPTSPSPAIPEDLAQPRSSALAVQESPAKSLTRSPVPPTKEIKPAPLQRVRISEEALQALLLSKTVPAYPPLARQAHVQGIVVLDADISKDGAVESLRVINGHPMLVPAAIDAVKQWRYKPFVINDQPVALNSKIMVHFVLSPK